MGIVPAEEPDGAGQVRSGHLRSALTAAGVEGCAGQRGDVSRARWLQTGGGGSGQPCVLASPAPHPAAAPGRAPLTDVSRRCSPGPLGAALPEGHMGAGGGQRGNGGGVLFRSVSLPLFTETQGRRALPGSPRGLTVVGFAGAPGRGRAAAGTPTPAPSLAQSRESIALLASCWRRRSRQPGRPHSPRSGARSPADTVAAPARGTLPLPSGMRVAAACRDQRPGESLPPVWGLRLRWGGRNVLLGEWRGAFAGECFQSALLKKRRS